MNRNEVLSVKEKAGYAVGDLAANLVFQTLVMFLAFFYTDILKIPTAAATMIIFYVGFFGAILFNPVMALIADRTNTKMGKFRPWILWTAVPFGLISILAFMTPDFSTTGKVIYALITYTLLLLVYSANNLPYSALSAVLTGNVAERNSVSSYRFMAVMIAQLIIQVAMFPIVDMVGDGDRSIGFPRVMIFLSSVGTILLLISFFTTSERVVPTKEQRSTVREDLKDLIGNRPWLIMLLLTTLVFVTLALKGGAYVYYFENYLDRDSMVKTLSLIGLSNIDNPSSYSFSLFNGGGIVMSLIGILFSKRLADKYGKRDVFGGALFLSTIFIILLFFIPPDRVDMVLLCQATHGFFYGITIPILWAMIADVADFSEWKNNRRATAIIFSAMLVGLKVGLTLGQTFVTALLDYYDYDPDLAQQSAETLLGIRNMVSIYAAIPFLVACGLLFFYEINKAKEIEIEEALKGRSA